MSNWLRIFRGYFFMWLVILPWISYAQNLFVKDDSLKSMLKHSSTTISKERIAIVNELMSRHFPNEPLFDSLQNDLIEKAEISRSRPLIAMTYNDISSLYLGFFNNAEYYEKGKFYADKTFKVAHDAGLEDFKVSAYLRYARYYLNSSQKQKALNADNEAISLASSIRSDSLLALCYLSIADTYESLANRLSQFQSLLIEREFAEKSKIHSLMIRSYYNLGSFYESMNDTEKAKDLYSLCLEKSKLWHTERIVFNTLRALGRTYSIEKNEKIGLFYYGKAIHLADSLNMPNLKIQAYLDILNYYFNSQDPKKGFAYLKIHPELLTFIKRMGFGYQVNKLYSVLQYSRKNYDSSLYYLQIALPFVYNKKGNYDEKFNTAMQLAQVLEKTPSYGEQVAALLKARSFADSSQDLYQLRDVSIALDSAELRTKNYRFALAYYQDYNRYRDSIEILSKQRDLLNIQLTNESKRAEVRKQEEEQATRVRYNLEYLGITAAIASVFIILIIMGVFKFSAAIVKGLGFFAFIFLFEFIVLLLDVEIHEITHGEPWKVLGVKIVIIGLLLPLHHYLEEKMVHYLTVKAYLIKPNLFRRSKSESSL